MGEVRTINLRQLAQKLSTALKTGELSQVKEELKKDQNFADIDFFLSSTSDKKTTTQIVNKKTNESWLLSDLLVAMKKIEESYADQKTSPEERKELDKLTKALGIDIDSILDSEINPKGHYNWRIRTFIADSTATTKDQRPETLMYFDMKEFEEQRAREIEENIYHGRSNIQAKVIQIDAGRGRKYGELHIEAKDPNRPMNFKVEQRSYSDNTVYISERLARLDKPSLHTVLTDSSIKNKVTIEERFGRKIALKNIISIKVEATNLNDSIDLIDSNLSSEVNSKDGNDRIYGTRSESNFIYAGNGNDIIHAGNAGNMIKGENGNDTIYGSFDLSDEAIFSDQFSGGAGNDEILTGFNETIVDGGSGNDHITVYPFGKVGSRGHSPESRFKAFINPGPDNDTVTITSNPELFPNIKASKLKKLPRSPYNGTVIVDFKGSGVNQLHAQAGTVSIQNFKFEHDRLFDHQKVKPTEIKQRKKEDNSGELFYNAKWTKLGMQNGKDFNYHFKLSETLKEKIDYSSFQESLKDLQKGDTGNSSRKILEHRKYDARAISDG